MSLRWVFIYLLRPRCHRKSFRTASRFPMPTTHEQPDFAHAKSFVLCSFQPTKCACSAAAEKCLSGVEQPLSSVSGRKRNNTLDFPEENRVPTGMLLAPIGNPEPRDCIPLDTRIFSSKMVPKLKNSSLTPFLRKYKTAVISILARMKITAVSFISLTQLSDNSVSSIFL